MYRASFALHDVDTVVVGCLSDVLAIFSHLYFADILHVNFG